MNRMIAVPVQRRSWKAARVIGIALLGLTALIGNLACVEIDGGAVELSWTLRDFDGNESNCQRARVEQVRLCWQAIEEGRLPDHVECVALATDAGFQEQFREFECTASRGVTRFEIQPGHTALFVEPVCVGGLEPEGPYQVPAPIVRLVQDGQVVTLNQLLIVVSNPDCSGTNCTCP